MEILLAKKGISLVNNKIEWEKGELFERFFFTEKMAKKNIFIYVYDEKYLREDFIEIEDEDDEKDNQNLEHMDMDNFGMLVTESCINILTYNQTYADEFLIYSNDRVNSVEPGIYPMMLYRIVLDLVEIIEGSSDNITLYENIKQCSTGSSNSRDSGTAHWRRHVQMTVLERIQLAQRLIQEKGDLKK